MATKLKLTAPLAITIAVLSFLYVEFTANFSFHWVTDGSLGNGLDMPAKFHLVIPIGFLTWGMFFVLGANTDAIKLVAINVVIGCVAALVCIVMIHAIKQFPDFWGISLSVAILAFVLVMSSAVSDLVNIPTIFVIFAGTSPVVAGDRRRRLVRRSGDAHASRRRGDARQGRWRVRCRRVLRNPVDPVRVRRRSTAS